MVNRKNDKIKYGVVAVALTILLWFICLIRGNVYPFGENSILSIDLATQYSQFFTFIKNTPPSQWIYSFSKGFGGNTLALVEYYCISVFNLFVFVFDSMETTIFVITTLKFTLMALCMYIYMSNHSDNGFLNSFLATAYALSPYFVIYYSNVIWFDCFALFPLLILQTEKIADGGKPGIFIALYTYCLYSNYYMARLCSVFILIYYFRYSVLYQKYTLKTVLARTFTMAYGAIVSILLACPVIIPSVKALGRGKLSEFSFYCYRQKPMFNPIGTMMYSMNGEWQIDIMPVIFVGLAELALMIAYFINPDIDKRKRVSRFTLRTVLILMMYIPQLYYMWSGFTWPQGFGFRVAFCGRFILLTIIADEIQNFHKKTGFAAAIIAGTLYFVINAVTDIGISTLSVAFIAILLLVMTIGDKQNKTVCCVWFMSVAFIASEMLMGASGNSYRSEANSYDEHIFNIRELTSGIQDSNFYRIEDTDSRPFNQPMALGYYGTSHFSSLYDQGQKDMYIFFGYEDTFYSTEYTHSYPYSDGFFGIKYLLNKNNPIPGLYEKLDTHTESGIMLYYNPYWLPVIFGAEEYDVPYADYWVDHINNMYITLTDIDTLNSEGNAEYDLLLAACEKIRGNRADIVVEKGSVLEFICKGKYMVSTIMYDENWQITVNGEKTEPLKFMEYFMALPLQEGENTIRMVYSPPGVKTGFAMFVAGVAAIILINVTMYIKEKRKGE